MAAGLPGGIGDEDLGGLAPQPQQCREDEVAVLVPKGDRSAQDDRLASLARQPQSAQVAQAARPIAADDIDELGPDVVVLGTPHGAHYRLRVRVHQSHLFFQPCIGTDHVQPRRVYGAAAPPKISQRDPTSLRSHMPGTVFARHVDSRVD